MLKAQNWEQWIDGHVIDALVKTMEALLEDFSHVRSQYNSAINALEQTQGTCCSDEKAAIERQLRSLVLFSGTLGLMANLHHFIDPIARDFLDVDFEVYLREETAHRLPEYKKAQQIREAFFVRLSPAERKIYEDVTEYACYLETVAPKLAHYYGYILGNDLLSQVIPGYHPDLIHTSHYKVMLERYLGIVFPEKQEPKAVL